VATQDELAQLKKELEKLEEQREAVRKQKHILETKEEEIRHIEARLRSSLLFVSKTLCQAPWCYENRLQLGGRYNDFFANNQILGRFDNYHSHIQLEEDVQLVLCDSSVYLRFQDTDNPNLMSDFVQRWGIKLETQKLKDRIQQIETELAQTKRNLEIVEKVQEEKSHDKA